MHPTLATIVARTEDATGARPSLRDVMDAAREAHVHARGDLPVGGAGLRRFALDHPEEVEAFLY